LDASALSENSQPQIPQGVRPEFGVQRPCQSGAEDGGHWEFVTNQLPSDLEVANSAWARLPRSYQPHGWLCGEYVDGPQQEAARDLGPGGQDNCEVRRRCRESGIPLLGGGLGGGKSAHTLAAELLGDFGQKLGRANDQVFKTGELLLADVLDRQTQTGPGHSDHGKMRQDGPLCSPLGGARYVGRCRQGKRSKEGQAGYGRAL